MLTLHGARFMGDGKLVCIFSYMKQQQQQQ
jgi:hypothetical protein